MPRDESGRDEKQRRLDRPERQESNRGDRENRASERGRDTRHTAGTSVHHIEAGSPGGTGVRFGLEHKGEHWPHDHESPPKR